MSDFDDEESPTKPDSPSTLKMKVVDPTKTLPKCFCCKEDIVHYIFVINRIYCCDCYQNLTKNE